MALPSTNCMRPAGIIITPAATTTTNALLLRFGTMLETTVCLALRSQVGEIWKLRQSREGGERDGVSPSSFLPRASSRGRWRAMPSRVA